MSLSEKRTPIIATFDGDSKIVAYNYPEEDVKESVKRLKKDMKECYTPSLYGELKEKIEKEFGKDLI